MYPLRGDRYKCVECKEDIGFDLCTKCHESRESNLKLGRFNQQHYPNHTFEGLKPGVARHLMFTLLSPPVLPVPPVPMVASPGDEAEELGDEAAEEPGDEESGDEAEEPESAESGDEAEEPESAESGDEEESEGTESGDEEESESAESRDEEESEGPESDDEEAVDSGGD